MTTKELDLHKQKLLQLKQNILNSGILKLGEDLCVSSDDLADETDHATNVINQHVSFSIRNRELQKLRAIEAALQRIQDGSYGICEDCDENIEFSRLKNQPWATLCIVHAEEREREHSRYTALERSRSVGRP